MQERRGALLEGAVRIVHLLARERELLEAREHTAGLLRAKNLSEMRRV